MAKRINTPFVAVVGTVCVLAVAALYLAPKLKQRIMQRPPTVMAREMANQADALFKQGKTAEAADRILHAHQMDPQNKDYCLQRGDILMATTGEEGYAAMVAARKSWQDALEIDPNFKPALSRLLDSYVEQIEVTGNVQGSVQLREIAEHLLRVDPKDVRAQAYLQIATIEQWAQGLPKSPLEKTGAIAALGDIYKKAPTPDVLYYLIQAKTILAGEQLHNSGAEATIASLADCRAQLESAAKSNPKDAAFNYRIFQCYQMLLRQDREPTLVKKNADLKNPDALNLDVTSASAALDATMRDATDTDPRFSEYHYASATWARQNRHLDVAEKTLRELYNAHKNDPRARLELARVLTLTAETKKRDEAIDLLDRPIVLTGAQADKWISLQELKAETLLDLTSLRVAKYATLEAAKRPAMLAQIEQGYNQVKGMSTPNNVPILRLEGLIDVLKNDSLGAVSALSHALSLLEHSDQNNQIKYDLMYQLANVYRQANQNRAAEKMLGGILDKYDFIPARVQLADLYLQENNLSDAAKQLAILAQQKPDAPEVLQMEIKLAVLRHRPDDVTKYLSQVPEKTFDEKLHKAQLAASVHDYAQTAGLLFQMLEERKDDVGLTIALYSTYKKLGQDDRAKHFLEDAIKHNSTEPRYKILIAQQNGVPIEELDKLMDNLVLGDAPFTRELEYGRRALAQDKLDEALQHAAAADQLQPDNASTWELRFHIYAQKGDQVMAMKAADNLGRLDADHAGGRVYRWLLAMNQPRPDYPTAISLAHEITDRRPEFGQSWIMLAQSYQGAGQYIDAIKQYQASLERQTTNIDAYIGMADSYDKLSQPDLAREILSRGTQVFPDSVALRERMLSYDTAKDPVAVVPRREKLLDDNPQDPENYLALSSALVHAAERVFASNPERSRQYIVKARDTLTKGVGKFPDHLRLNSALAESDYNADRFDAGVKILQDLDQLPAWKDKPDPKLMLGEYYVRAKKPELAEATFRQAWAMTGNKKIDIELRIVALMEDQQRFDDALKLLKTNADDPRVQSQTLQVHIAANHTDEASRMLDEMISQQPQNLDFRNLKAVVQIDGGRYDDARRTIAQALALDPKNTSDITRYYEAILESRDPAKGDLLVAMRDFSEIVTHSPNNVQFKMEYANLLQRINDPESASVQLEDVLKLEPYNVDARVKLLDIYTLSKRWQQFEKTVTFAELNPRVGGPAGIWQRADAYAHAAQGRYDIAVAKIQEAISMDLKNERYQRDYLVILLQSKNNLGVLNTVESAVATGHKQWWLFHIRGLAYIAMGNKDRALEELDKAIAEIDATKDIDVDAYQQVINSVAEVSLDEAIARLKPRLDVNPRWRIESVAMHMRKMEWKEAQAQLQPLLDRRDKMDRGQRISVIRLAADVYQSTHQFELAKSAYLEWLKESPGDTTALNNIAYMYANDLNNPAEAKQYIEKAYKAGQKINVIDPMIKDTYGWVLTLNGGADATTGLAVLSSVVDEHPNLLDARYHLARAYLKRNQPDSAIPVLNETLDRIKKMEEGGETVSAKLKADVQAALTEAKNPVGPAASR